MRASVGQSGEVFVRLYEEGLIYRGDYIINWCPRCHTALSDLEVEYKETQGKFYFIHYPFKKGKRPLLWQRPGRKPCWAIPR